MLGFRGVGTRGLVVEQGVAGMQPQTGGGDRMHGGILVEIGFHRRVVGGGSGLGMGAGQDCGGGEQGGAEGRAHAGPFGREFSGGLPLSTGFSCLIGVGAKPLVLHCGAT